MKTHTPDWPAPPNVHALTSLRTDGVSEGNYCGFNLATHVGDLPAHVAENRAELCRQLALPKEPHWLTQTHSTKVICLPHQDREGDAAYSDQAGEICTVLTADCLPILICDQTGTEVAAIHAGWRGLAAGIVEETLKHFKHQTQALLAWLGPAIGPQHFEVGPEVRACFLAYAPEVASCFIPHQQNTWLCDLYGLARHRLHQAGLFNIYGGTACTYASAQNFYSYRRDGKTGRMATLIWYEEAHS